MKKILAILLTLCMLMSLSVTAMGTSAEDFFAQNGTTNIDLTLQLHGIPAPGVYRSDVSNGTATVNTDDGITVTVKGAPDTAVRLNVVPLPADLTEAMDWVEESIGGIAYPMHTFDIYFEDAMGARINLQDVEVTASCSHCADANVLIALTAGGRTAIMGEVGEAFTAGGSHYYVLSKIVGKDEPWPGDGQTIPVYSEENHLNVQVEVDGDTAKLHELNENELDHILGGEGSGDVIIDLSKLDGVSRVNLPTSTLEYIVENAPYDTESLVVIFPNGGSVRLDDPALRALADHATCGEVILVVEEVGVTRMNEKQAEVLSTHYVYAGYEAYLLCMRENKRISDFNGGVATLTMPFTLPAGHNAGGFKVWHIDDEGAMEQLKTWYKQGFICWDVGHFSDFVVLYKLIADNGNDGSYDGLIHGPEQDADVESTRGGDVEISDENPQAGDTVTILPKPNEGKEVDEVIVRDQDGNLIPVVKNSDGTYSFVQPNGKVTI